MKVKVDAALCTGQGRCYVVSPEMFTPDDEGFCAERGTEREVPPGMEDRAQHGADSCPEGAITIIE